MPDPTLVPMLLALLAASLFGAQAVLARRALRYVNAQTGAMLSIVVAAGIFWVLYAVARADAAHWRSPGLWVFATNGLLHPLLSMFLSFEANRRMGATVSATIAATTPLFAAAGAVLGLGEGLTVEIVLGTVGIVAGVVALSWQGSAARGWPLGALAFPTGAAVVRAFNHVWGRFGVILLPVPLFAAAVSFTVSGGLSVAAYRWRTGHLPGGIPRQGLFWSLCSGLTVAAAILAMYTSLAIGPVVVVSPIMNTYPLFTLAWSLLFRQERFSSRVGLGALLVVGGVTLIGLR